MPFRRVIFLVVAIGLSFVTALVVRDWVATVRQEVAPLAAPRPATTELTAPPASEPTQVLVAARALPTGHLLTDEDWRWQSWPDANVAPAYIVKTNKDREGLAGSVVREAIAAGEPITGERLVRRGERGFLAAVLAPGRRAITMAITTNPPLNGLVGPGDRVDLIATTNPVASGQRKPKPPVSETLLHDVRLLALDQRLDDQPGNFPPPRTATLEVTPKQAEMVALAADRAKLSLSLRSNSTPEAGDEEPGPLAWDDTPAEPLVPPLRTEPVTGAKVSIIRGASVSELEFPHPAK